MDVGVETTCHKFQHLEVEGITMLWQLWITTLAVKGEDLLLGLVHHSFLGILPETKLHTDVNWCFSNLAALICVNFNPQSSLASMSCQV